MFTVVLPPHVLASAMRTAEERPRNIKHHVPSSHPDADLWGAMSEHAFAYHLGMPTMAVDSSGGPDGRGDGGVDFTVYGETIDVKSSGKHDSSWVVPRGDLKADWYVFAYVILPDTVVFKGKARREDLEPIKTSEKVGGKRLVYLEEVEDIGPQDFTRKPGRP